MNSVLGELNPWLNFFQVTTKLVGISISLPLIVIGLFLMFSWRTVKKLSCSRESPEKMNCSFSTSTLLGAKTVKVPLGKLEKVELELLKNSGFGNQDEEFLYRIILTATQNTIPWSNEYRSDKEEQENRVRRIQEFLQNQSQPSLQIIEIDWLFLILGGILTASGSVFLTGSVQF